MYSYLTNNINIIIADASGLAVDSKKRKLYYINDMQLFETNMDGLKHTHIPADYNVSAIAIEECERYHRMRSIHCRNLKLNFSQYPSIHTNYIISHCTTL